MEPWQLDATALAAQIRTGNLSAREATASVLARVEAVNPSLNAVVRVLGEEAMTAAAAADERQARGEPLGPLHGVPVTTKVNVDQAGCPTDNGIRALADLVASEDAPLVANLRRAGAILFGRTNAPAFSMRGMTSNQLHGLTRNPWDRDVTCGGSSGGAGAAVAAGMGPIAHGNDIGGSIRWPAYCNGVVGLRPTIGRIPSFNPTATVPRPFSGQLMAVQGPLTRTVRDARLALAAMSPGDARDPLWVPAPLDGPPPAHPVRVALVAEPSSGSPVHPAVAAAVRRAGAHLAAAGYAVEEVEPPELEQASELWHPIGVTQLAHGLVPMLPTFGDPALSTFITRWVEAKGVADAAGLLAALGARDALVRRWQVFFETYPIVVLPSCAEVSLPAESDHLETGGPDRMLEALRFQLVLPTLGLPGLAVPVGSHEGQPLGVQLVAARFREDLCLAAGEVVEAHEGVSTPIDPRF